jgi:hypothetical protein
VVFIVRIDCLDPFGFAVAYLYFIHSGASLYRMRYNVKRKRVIALKFFRRGNYIVESDSIRRRIR